MTGRRKKNRSVHREDEDFEQAQNQNARENSLMDQTLYHSGMRYIASSFSGCYYTAKQSGKRHRFMNITLTNLRVRPVQPADNPHIARVIREVSAEFGLTADKGFTVADLNLDRLFDLYSKPDSAYWVIELDGQIMGGGGVAPLQGSEADICELQKMYFMPAIRSMGMARELAMQAMDFARELGFKRCYLETTATLTRAIRLYEHLGFQHINGPMGCTGHVDCEVRMLRWL